MKRVYIVRGSEDGNLGVYTTAKKAFNRALEYVAVNGGTKDTLPVAKKKLKEFSYFCVNANSHNVTVEIEAFYLND